MPTLRPAGKRILGLVSTGRGYTTCFVVDSRSWLYRCDKWYNKCR